MKQRKSKRISQFLAALLCVSMLLPLIPTTAFAAQTGTKVSTVAKSELDKLLDCYVGGTMSNTIAYDCGNDITGAGEKSYLTMVTGTHEAEFETFKTNLKDSGYTAQREWSVESNLFGSYLASDGSYRVYTYFFPAYGETRIIVDTEQRTVNGFTYEAQESTVQPTLVMWGLPMSPYGTDITEQLGNDIYNQRNCGAMTVIRMPDNSLFIHDGGDVYQWNDEACDAFVAFCRELTGITEGKMVINTWFLSHGHSDHFRGFWRLMNQEYDSFELKNVMYNIDKEREGEIYDITGAMKMLKTIYPDVQYYKPHTGEELDIAGVKLNILYTQEDRFVPNSSNQLAIDTDNVGGTYRIQKEGSTTSNFNDTSTAVKIVFPNNVSSILYGDLTNADTHLTSVYPGDTLNTDIMQLPHHGHDVHTDLVNKADAKVYLYNQHKSAAYGPDDDVTTEDLYGTYNKDLRTRFLTMFPGMKVAKGVTPDVGYDVFWAGTNTVTIDIAKLDAGADDYATTAAAQSFEYTGWGVQESNSDPLNLPDALISAENEVTEAEKELTSTNSIRFDPVVIEGDDDAAVTKRLIDNKRYIIKHVATNYVMSYDAVAAVPGEPNKAGSFVKTAEKLNARPEEHLNAHNVYYENSEGKIYLDHSNRALAIWILHQDGKDKTALDDTTTDNRNNALFGGKYVYGSTYLNKGNVDVYEGTTKIDGHHGIYWNAQDGMDESSPSTQYRFLDQRYASEDTKGSWVKTSEPCDPDNQSKHRYVIEYRSSDKTYLVYWRSNAGDVVCFLTCDQDGNWGIKKYTDATNDEYPAVPGAKSEELNSLKLKFYVYNDQIGSSNNINKKRVQFEGKKNYTVTTDATLADITAYIESNIALKDKNRNSLDVPCSGTTPKVGYYYLKFDKSVSYDMAGEYTVKVCYRNDNNSDTEITTLTVNVLKRDLTFSGATTHYVNEGVTKEQLVSSITSGEKKITVTNTLTDVSGAVYGSAATVQYMAIPTAGCYWLDFDSNFDSSATGDHDYMVDVKYRKHDGTDVVVKTLSVIVDAQIEEWNAPATSEGTVALNAGLGAVVKAADGKNITFTVNGQEKLLSVGMLVDENGNPVDTSKESTYNGLKVVYGGVEICDNFTLIVSKGNDALNYPDKGMPGYVGVDKDGKTSVEDFSKTGVAEINLSASGVPVEKGVDLILVIDISGSMRYAVDGTTYLPKDQYSKTRIYTLEQSLKQMIETLGESGADVRIAMTDFGDLDHFTVGESVLDDTIPGKVLFDVNYNHSTRAGYGEFNNHLNYVLSSESLGGFDKTSANGATTNLTIHDNPFGIGYKKFELAEPTYGGYVTPNIYTGSGQVNADAFIPVSKLHDGTGFTLTMDEIIAQMDVNAYGGFGTNYDVGLEYAYYLGHAIQQDNIAKGEDRKVVCIFMSDGAPMQFNYFSGTSHGPGWPAWITGAIDYDKLETKTVNDITGNDVLNINNKNKKGILPQLLDLLKAGKLERYGYERHLVDVTLYEKSDGSGSKSNSAELDNGYYLYRARLGDGDKETFYEIMAQQECDIDWDYLCEIASANGIENFSEEYYREDPACEALLKLFNTRTFIGYEKKDGQYYKVYRTKLINPSLTMDRYYPKCDASFTNFFDAMKSIGVDCNWELLANLAWNHHSQLNGYQKLNSGIDEYNNDLVKFTMDLRKVSSPYTHKTYSNYPYFYNSDGRNWWAEAIKGDPSKLYPVINKYAYKDSDVQPYTYYGDKRNNFTGETTKGLPLDGQDYIAGYRGLGINIYSISFSVANDNYITAADCKQVLQRISSNAGDGTTGSFYHTADSEETLTAALKTITASMSVGATRAYFTDTMGAEYDLYVGDTKNAPKQPESGKNGVPTPYIKVQEYSVDAAGNRTLVNTRETITFKLNGNTMEAYSDQVYTTSTENNSITKNYINIWDQTTGIINGQFVKYNTNKAGTNKNLAGTNNLDVGEGDVVNGVYRIDLAGDGKGYYKLNPETFFWTIGNLGENEVVLDYFVYMPLFDNYDQNTVYDVQYYDTNTNATLNYINYLGNSCNRDTVSPKYPWGRGILENVVVVDYGVPVNINILDNTFGLDNPSVTGINAADQHDKDNEYVSSTEDQYGTIKLEGNKVQYQYTTMEVPGVDTFTVQVTESGHIQNYGTVKVVPATTIYYEENFLEYQVFQYVYGTSGKTEITEITKDPNYDSFQWMDMGQAGNGPQDEDRPGNLSAETIDANNLYGYDSAYLEMQTYSMNCAKMFTASMDEDNLVTYGTASFTFKGTGFDVISLTSGQTGTITVKAVGTIKDKNGNVFTKGHVVDTYYGYSYDQSTGKWEISKNPIDGTGTSTNTLYQVPVMKFSDLPYDTYTVTITVSYNDFFDHSQYPDQKKYDFYLDAIRIYDPADDGNTSDEIKDAYIADGEGWPEYFELRNLLIKAEQFDILGEDDEIKGIIFIDGNKNLQGDAAIEDYKNYGPNNELYLAPGQAVSFHLGVATTSEAVSVASIQLALKSVGGEAMATVYNAYDQKAINLLNGSNAFEGINTATDLYYDITNLNNKTVVIMNHSDATAILSITNVKVTYTSDPDSENTPDAASYFKVRKNRTEKVLASIMTVQSNVGEMDPGEVINGTIDLVGASLSFEDEILTNLYFTVSDVNATEMGLLTWSSEPVNGTIENAENIYVGAAYVERNDQYMVQTAGIAAKNLGDDIYMRVYAKTENGIVYSDVTKYSPKQYALSRLKNSQNENMKALCVAILNYGAAAQEFFGYKTEDLMNASLTADQKALVNAYSADLVTGAVAADASKIGTFAKTDGFSAKSASVSFEGAFAINYYFSTSAEAAGDVTFFYWNAADYVKVNVLTADNATGTFAMDQQANGIYWAQVAGIAAKELDDTFYVAAMYTDANGNTYCTGVIAYSVSQYCVNNANTAMADLAQATAVYGYHAKNYFNIGG